MSDAGSPLAPHGRHAGNMGDNGSYHASHARHAKRRDRSASPLWYVGVSISAVLIGYFLVEYCVNAGWGFLSRDPLFTLGNLALYAAAYLIIYLIGQRTHGAVALFLTACFIIGIANHYVIMFKGQPIAPADLLALSTAADVAGSYSFAPDSPIIICAVVFIASCIGLHFTPKAPRTKRSVITCTACGLAIACACVGVFVTCDVEDDFGCEVSSWDPGSSYRANGTAACFVKRVQDVFPVAPDDYSPEEAARILSAYGDENILGNDEKGADAPSAATKERPNVIIIMNEAFSDLSYLPGLADTEACPSRTRALSEEAVYSGNVYVSVYGAGTCNSEFEYLTSATMGLLGNGVYPYSTYDLSNTQSLVSYFKALGYGTAAVHPAEAANWSRDRVYSSFGFDRFDDVSTFTDAEILRYYTTDAETYDRALEIIEEEDAPQFVFGVTLQNHGGYATGLIPEEDAVSVPAENGENAELNEYVSLLQRSDKDIAAFIDALRDIDEPTIVCFFGDHQPALTDWPFPNDGMDWNDVDMVSARFNVPYFIWANYDTGLPTGTVVDTSLNYLASMTIEAAQLPETPLLDYVGNLRSTLSAVTGNGWRDDEGTWHEFSDASEYPEIEDALHDYAIVQFDNLF